MGHNRRFNKHNKRSRTSKSLKAYYQKKSKLEEGNNAEPHTGECSSNSLREVTVTPTTLDNSQDEGGTQLPSLTVEYGASKNSWTDFKGRRIVNLGYVISQALSLQADHLSVCTGGRLEFHRSTNRGLLTLVWLQCRVCSRTFALKSEDPDDNNLDVNASATWGAISSGLGFSQMEEFLAVLDVPAMSDKKFQKDEAFLEEQWQSHLWDVMKRTGEEEKNQAIAAGHVDREGVPWIRVCVDGGWAKRSYGHKGSSSSGVACIIGYNTKKLLYLDVRNKYCCVCHAAESKGCPSPNHKCFRNWRESSSAMEADIIVQGFCLSEEMHGLRYKEFVGDGDSSVHHKIIELVPYGKSVKKIECANHIVRNYTSHLHTLAANTKFSAEDRKIVRQNIPRLTYAARSAIARQGEKCGSVSTLQTDLLNGPYHVFGDHSRCVECSRKDLEETNYTIRLKTSGIFHHIMALVNPIAAKSGRLIDNDTSNRAELYMSLLAKYNCGKRINYTKRGSFQGRAVVAGLSYQRGASWYRSPFKLIAKRSPGVTLKRLATKRTKRLQKMNEKSQSKRRLRFGRSVKRHPQPKKKDSNYGPSANKPDLSDEEMSRAKETFVRELQVNEELRNSYENSTRDQSNSELWFDLRRNRLTASNFGVVCKRRDSTPSSSLVKRLVYGKQVNVDSVKFGLDNESLAREQFKFEYDVEVQTCGLFIDIENGWLGASPDGIVVNNNSILEIKCLPSVTSHSLKEEVMKRRDFCLELSESDILQLKRTHNYYYQIQGQLHVTQKQLCFFIVWTKTAPLFVEKIVYDPEFWKEKMFPKLRQFYFECLLPEIVDSRVQRSLALREPDYIQKKLKKTPSNQGKS